MALFFWGASGLRDSSSVCGGDSPTPDGTGVRDYLHLVDLAKGHLKALEALDTKRGALCVNLGTWCGYSLLGMITAFDKSSGRTIPYEVIERRPSDIAQCYADPAYAMYILNWEAEHGIKKMCEEA